MPFSSSAEYFGKRVIVKVYTKGDDPYQQQERLFFIDSDEGFRINFRVRKNITSEPNTCTINIYNLDLETCKTFASKKIWVELHAGFKEDITPIYCGGISTVSINKSETDRICTLICRTDWDLKKKLYVGDFFGLTTLDTILQSVLKQAKIPYRQDSILVSGSTGERGLCGIYTVKGILDDLANWYKFSWSLQDYGFLALSDDQVLPVTTTITSPLIDSYLLPKEDERNSGGYDVTCLLNGSFQIGNNVTFSTDIHGVQTFKIYQIIQSGDTHGNQWYTNLVGYAAGSLTKVQRSTNIFEIQEGETWS